MDKQIKQSIQIFVRKLLEARTQDVSYETLELLSVFIIYGIEQEHYLEEPHASYKEIFKTTIEELSRNFEPVQELLLPVLTYVDANLELVDEIVDSSILPYHDSMLHPNESINFCLSLFEEYKGQRTNNLITPRAILELSRDIAGLTDDAIVLDLHARKGEWSDLLTEEMFSEYLSLTDCCFEPHHFVISSLKAKLSAPNNRQVSFHSNYDLSDIKEGYYDVVFANPSFANMPLESSWRPKAKVHSQFLYYAFKACKPGGSIIYVVPESFLNSGGKFDHKLRKELVREGSLKTVIQLPNSTFSPYTKVHTAILVIEKSTEESDVTFIDLNKKTKKLGHQEIENIVALNRRKTIDSKLPYSVTSLDEIVESDFDLRAPRYIEKSVSNTSISPQELNAKITQKEKELQDIRSKIEDLIGLMEQKI